MRRTLVLACLALLSAAGRADAGYLLTLDTPSALVAPGSTVSVDVYIEQDGGSVGLDDGLIAAGFRVNFASADPSTLAIVTGLTPNADFDDPLTTTIDYTPGTNAGEVIVQLNDLFGVAPIGGRILLATLQLLAPASGVTALTVSELDAAPGAIDFAAVFEDLDPVAPGALTITVDGAVVPEPASLAPFALGSAFALAIARRRRRPASA